MIMKRKKKMVWRTMPSFQLLARRRQTSGQLLAWRRRTPGQALAWRRRTPGQPLAWRRRTSRQPLAWRRGTSGQPLAWRRRTSGQPLVQQLDLRTWWRLAAMAKSRLSTSTCSSRGFLCQQLSLCHTARGSPVGWKGCTTSGGRWRKPEKPSRKSFSSVHIYIYVYVCKYVFVFIYTYGVYKDIFSYLN